MGSTAAVGGPIELGGATSRDTRKDLNLPHSRSGASDTMGPAAVQVGQAMGLLQVPGLIDAGQNG
jgi:hypothetical protein